tara:strand:+ start:34053 stop:34220 length:168 start_codon:yes stop_codon:yes gene_type:complete
MHLNGILFFPTLFCRKKIGPFELNFISNEIIRNNGRKAIRNKRENNKSKRFLMNL